MREASSAGGNEMGYCPQCGHALDLPPPDSETAEVGMSSVAATGGQHSGRNRAIGKLLNLVRAPIDYDRNRERSEALEIVKQHGLAGVNVINAAETNENYPRVSDHHNNGHPAR